MSRHCLQLLPSTVEALKEGADFLLVETMLKDYVDEGQIDHYPNPRISAAALISTVTNDNDRYSLRRLKDCFLSGRNSARTIEGSWADQFRGSLGLVDGGQLDIVFAIPGSDDSGTVQLKNFLASIPSLACDLGVVLLVTDAPDLFKNLAGIDGIVFTAGSIANAASHVFKMLASMASPHTITCLDTSDIWVLFGSGAHPAQLAEAVWIRNSQQLIFASPEDEAIVANATESILISSIVDAPTWKQAKKVLWEVRKLQGPEIICRLSQSMDFISPSYLSDKVDQIMILCGRDG